MTTVKRDPDPRASRASIIASVDFPEEVEAAEAWLEASRDRLTYVSDQLGCGCCVLIWDVEGPAELIDGIPGQLRCYSAWDPVPVPETRLRRLARLFRIG